VGESRIVPFGKLRVKSAFLSNAYFAYSADFADCAYYAYFAEVGIGFLGVKKPNGKIKIRKIRRILRLLEAGCARGWRLEKLLPYRRRKAMSNLKWQI